MTDINTDVPTTPGEASGETTPPASESTPGAGTGSDTSKTFTQDDVARLLSLEKKKAKSSALTGLLADVGLEDIDALKTTLADWKAHQDGQKTELQKAQEKLTVLESADKKAKDTEAALQQAMDILSANVESQLKALQVPEHIAALIKAMPTTEALDYINKNATALRPTQQIPDIDANKDGRGTAPPSLEERRAELGKRFRSLSKH